MPDAVCFDSLLLLPPPGFTGICSNVVTFLLCRLVCSGFFFNSFGFYFSPATTQPRPPLSPSPGSQYRNGLCESVAFLFPFAGWKKLTWITRLSQQMKFFECKTHTNSFWLYCCLVVIIGYLFNQALWPLWGCFSLFFSNSVLEKSFDVIEGANIKDFPTKRFVI